MLRFQDFLTYGRKHDPRRLKWAEKELPHVIIDAIQWWGNPREVNENEFSIIQLRMKIRLYDVQAAMFEKCEYTFCGV